MRCNVGGSSSPNTGGGYKLVWTNPNPNVAFVGQTINIDKSYKAYIIKSKTIYNEDKYIYCYMKTSQTTNTCCSYQVIGYGVMSRTIEITDNGRSLVFGATLKNGGESGNHNDRLIPNEIYATNKEIG